MDANRLRNDIKTERYEGDMLEVSQSALGSPSRIRAIAGEAMGMAPARKITYLDMQKAARSATSEKASPVSGETASAAQPTVPAAKGAAGVVAKMMNLSAGEAQVLLVGDMGLSAAR